MHAEVIAIGDEITSGQLLDTNTQWLSERLEELGIRVLYHTTAGDEIDAIAGVFRLAIERADVIVATGGLGPTADDLTRQAIAAAAGRRLVMDPQALAHVRAIFKRRNRPMPVQNEVQGLLPEGGRMIDNPNGTAPGIAMTIPRGGAECHLFSLPGVPAEMREMWFGSVEGQLRSAGAGRRTVRHRKIRCFGAGESQIESMLPDLIRRGRVPRVGINASKSTIVLRITAEAASAEECHAAIEPTVETIRQCLGNLVFGEGDDELQNAVGRLLSQQQRTLATAEWGTGGTIAQWLSEAPEAAEYYLGGVVLSSSRAAAATLGLPDEVASGNSPASEPAAAALATACRERFGADYGLAIGPFPPFDPGAATPNAFWIALAGPQGVATRSHAYAAHPAILNVYCAKLALNFVRLELQGGAPLH